jgi:hypothetical protein
MLATYCWKSMVELHKIGEYSSILINDSRVARSVTRVKIAFKNVIFGKNVFKKD